MSTFPGILDEYPLISVDKFVKENYASTVYFLSHCHSDHMYGLKNWGFYVHLQKRVSSKIYLSEVSKQLLKNDLNYAHLSDYLESIPIEQPTTIVIPKVSAKKTSKVVVTLLPAGHCPGSVMFLFEGYNGTILYTGDFRFAVGDVKRIKHLHYKSGRVKPIKQLYLDTTFCKAKSLHIPSRQDCLDAIFSLVEPWIKNGPDHIVYFDCPANYGYEYIFVALFEQFDIKTHVNHAKCRKYKGILEISQAVTGDPSSARIHACTEEYHGCAEYTTGQTMCGYFSSDGRPVKVRRIKPSAMFFTENIKQNDIIKYDTKTGVHRVCYSTHSSLTELRDMVSHLQPQSLYPNVTDEKPHYEILKWLLPVLTPIQPKETEFKMPLLGQLKTKKDNDIYPSSEDSFIFNYDVSKNTNEPPKRDDCDIQQIASKTEILLPNQPFPNRGNATCSKFSESYNAVKRSYCEVNVSSDDECNTTGITNFESKSTNWIRVLAEKIEHDEAYQRRTNSPPKWEYPPLSSDESEGQAENDSLSFECDETSGERFVLKDRIPSLHSQQLEADIGNTCNDTGNIQKSDQSSDLKLSSQDYTQNSPSLSTVGQCKTLKTMDSSESICYLPLGTVEPNFSKDVNVVDLSQTDSKFGLNDSDMTPDICLINKDSKIPAITESSLSRAGETTQKPLVSTTCEKEAISSKGIANNNDPILIQPTLISPFARGMAQMSENQTTQCVSSESLKEIDKKPVFDEVILSDEEFENNSPSLILPLVNFKSAFNSSKIAKSNQTDTLRGINSELVNNDAIHLNAMLEKSWVSHKKTKARKLETCKYKTQVCDQKKKLSNSASECHAARTKSDRPYSNSSDCDSTPELCFSQNEFNLSVSILPDAASSHSNKSIPIITLD